jgi:hypothetical protein
MPLSEETATFMSGCSTSIPAQSRARNREWNGAGSSSGRGKL